VGTFIDCLYPRGRKAERSFKFIKKGGIFLSGTVFLILPFFVYFFRTHSMGALYYDLGKWIFPGYYSFDMYPSYFWYDNTIIEAIFKTKV